MAVNLDLSLDGKAIVIVGGTSGLGRAGAQACLAAGARLVIVGKDSAKLADTCEELGDRVVGVSGDASDSKTVEGAVAKAVGHFGRLDGLYHVAGGSGRVYGDGPLHELNDQGWAYTINLNLGSVAYSNRAALAQFLRQGTGGAILNLSSVLAFSPSKDYFATHAYAAAKAAIIGLTRATAAYYAKQSIRCNVICPALVATPMSARVLGNAEIMSYISSKQPLHGGHAGQPNDLDAAVIYFLSDASRFVTGQVLAIDGGWTVSEGNSNWAEDLQNDDRQ